MDDASQTEMWFKTIHDNIPVGIFRTTQDGRFLSVNPALAAKHGYSSTQEMMQVPVAEMYWDPGERATVIERLKREEKISLVEIRFKRKNGTAYWGALTAQQVIGSDGSIQAYGIVQDISGQKEMAVALKKAHDDLEQRVRARTTELSRANTQLMEQVGERERLHEQLLISQKNLALTNVDLENAILKANQMAADAEVRNYELEIEVERRKKSEAALGESENRYRSIIENIEDGYSELDRAGHFIFCNEAMCRIVGFTASELAQMKNTDILVPEERADVMAAFTKVRESGRPLTAHRFTVVRKNGQQRQVEASISLIPDAGGNGIGFRGIVRDVEARRQYEEQLIYQAHHDALTGLKNRRAFYDRLREAITFAARYRTTLALVYIDIDRFKQVNDTLGHETGDLLLKEIASRLLHQARKTDFPARLGGDEFAIILNDPKDIKVSVFGERIVSALSEPYHLNGHRVDYVSASIGTSGFPDDATDPDTLVRCADKAMYRAKEKRNRFVQCGDIQP